VPNMLSFELETYMYEVYVSFSVRLGRRKLRHHERTYFVCLCSAGPIFPSRSVVVIYEFRSKGG